MMVVQTVPQTSWVYVVRECQLPTTIKQVAAHVGVSVSTVSRALTGNSRISVHTRERVQQAVRELEYRPNVSARRLKQTHTHVVGLIVPDISNDFYAVATARIQAALTVRGYRLLITITGNSAREEAEHLQAMRDERVDGIVYVPTGANSSLVREMWQAGLPVIELARKSGLRDVDAVLADYQDGTRQALDHLLERGHRRIGLICGPLDLSTSRERQQGYLDALAAAGVPVDQALIKVGPYQRDWAAAAMRELLVLDDPPSAVLASSNEFTVGVLRTLTSQGILYPDQISIVGFGDPEWFSLTRPAITTVMLPAEEMAGMAASLLMQRLDAPSERSAPMICRLSTRLISRASTATRSSLAG